jgi:hypothetical protein
MLMARPQMEGQHYELLLCGIPRRAGHVVLGRDYRGWRSRSLGDAASRSALRGCRMPPFELAPFDMLDTAKIALLADVNPAQKGVFAMTPLKRPC